jgi:hypothetical protein
VEVERGGWNVIMLKKTKGSENGVGEHEYMERGTNRGAITVWSSTVSDLFFSI